MNTKNVLFLNFKDVSPAIKLFNTSDSTKQIAHRSQSMLRVHINYIVGSVSKQPFIKRTLVTVHRNFHHWAVKVGQAITVLSFDL